MFSTKWTQDEPLAYERARECITDFIAIISELLANEGAKEARNPQLISHYESMLSKLAHERYTLTIHDRGNISRIRSVYGAKIMKYRETYDATEISL